MHMHRLTTGIQEEETYTSHIVFVSGNLLPIFLCYRAPPGVFLPPSPWAWVDPGAFALIGAGAFMGGVTRLTISVTVIMMEVLCFLSTCLFTCLAPLILSFKWTPLKSCCFAVLASFIRFPLFVSTYYWGIMNKRMLPSRLSKA